MPRGDGVDRAAAVRDALRRLVARHGFHGASMNAVAREAGVATGTAYVHYPSKEELVFAAHFELKRKMSQACTKGIDPSVSPRQRFEALWLALYRFLRRDREQARFLLQMEASPYAGPAHDRFMAEQNDPMMAMAQEPDMAACLVSLPLLVVYDLGLASAVRLAASEERITDEDLQIVARQCWRAITRRAGPEGDVD